MLNYSNVEQFLDHFDWQLFVTRGCRRLTQALLGVMYCDTCKSPVTWGLRNMPTILYERRGTWQVGEPGTWWVYLKSIWLSALCARCSAVCCLQVNLEKSVRVGEEAKAPGDIHWNCCSPTLSPHLHTWSQPQHSHRVSGDGLEQQLPTFSTSGHTRILITKFCGILKIYLLLIWQKK